MVEVPLAQPDERSPPRADRGGGRVIEIPTPERRAAGARRWPRSCRRRCPVLPLKDSVPVPGDAHAARGRPGALGQAGQRRAGRRPDAGDGRRRASGEIENPGPDDIYDVGVAGTVARMIKVPDGTLRILVHGAQRVQLGEYRPDASPTWWRKVERAARRGRALARARGRCSATCRTRSARSSRRCPTCPRSCRSRWPTSRTRRSWRT